MPEQAVAISLRTVRQPLNGLSLTEFTYPAVGRRNFQEKQYE